jgi:kinetochore protein NDC80
LSSALKLLNCPLKLNKSAVSNPGTPHAWPSLLAVMHWLVQIAMCCPYMDAESSPLEANTMNTYSMTSYLHYMEGDDDSVDLVDREYMDALQKQRDKMEEDFKKMEEQARDLEATLERLKTEPSGKEVLEKEKKMLEEDVNKFHAMIEQLNGHIVTVEKVLNDKDKELEVKIEEKKRICDENEELKKKVDEQVFNTRDAERMKRELQAVERDVVEAELARNSWEDKSWDLDATTRQKLKDLEALLNECNQCIKRLKLGSNIQYEVNPKGSTAAEVLGLDYKSTLQPKLASLAEEIKTSSMATLEEQISLERTQFEYATKIEAKKMQIAALQSRIDKDEVQLNQLKQEAQDYISQCASEARKLAEDVEGESHKVDILEKEAVQILQTSNSKLQESIEETEEEVQGCAREFFEVVDSVSKFKEYMSAKTLEIKNELVCTVADLSDLHKGSLRAYVDTSVESKSTQLCELIL